MNTMTNEEYLEYFGISKTAKHYQACLEILGGYGDNKWWLSEDPRVRAYYQTFEKRSLYSWKQYGSDLFVLLGRKPDPNEMFFPMFRLHGRVDLLVAMMSKFFVSKCLDDSTNTL